MTNPEEVKEEKKSLNFIEAKVEEDLANGKNGGRVQTRFPPEPNGYLHIGHAKAICLDFGIAAQHGGVCNLRFDDTNPTKENMEYVDAIKEDIQWLGYQWGNEYYASDYFQQLWDFAIELIKRGKAYIDEQSSEEIAAQKGTPTQPGIESPYRNRPVEESLDLFNKMNNGEIGEGKMVLRAKIDMANPNMHFRDPIIYRVVDTPHHRTGSKWHAYPMYDFAHGQSDYFEGVTHSLCTPLPPARGRSGAPQEAEPQPGEGRGEAADQTQRGDPRADRRGPQARSPCLPPQAPTSAAAVGATPMAVGGPRPRQGRRPRGKE